MKLNKSFLIFCIIFLLLVGSVFGVGVAPNSTDAKAYYKLSNNINDETGNYDGVAFGTLDLSATGGIIGGKVAFDGSSDALIKTGLSGFVNDNWTVSLWFKTTDSTNIITPFSFNDYTSTTPLFDFYINIDGAEYVGIQRRQTVAVSTSGEVEGICDGEWHHFIGTKNGTVARIYIDGVYSGVTNEQTATYTVNRATIGAALKGTDVNPSYKFDGDIDEVGFFNTVLSDDEITYLYASGSPGTEQQYPFSLPSVVHSLETNILFEQSSELEINSNNYQLVESQTFTPLNNSNGSISATLEVTTTKSLEMQCKILINDVDYDTEINRSFDSASVGNLYLLSSVFEVNTSVNYTASLWCRRTSVNGKILINKSVGIASLFLDVDNGKEINYKYMRNSFEINSSTYQLLANTTFLTSNLSSNSLIRNLVFDGQISYNYDSAGTINLYSVVNGVISPVFNRYGSAGTFGSGGNFNIVYNVSNETSVPVLIYGKSTSGDGSVDVKLYIKEMIGHAGEFNSSGLNGTSLTSTSWATAKTITINNTHDLTDLVVKASASTKSLSGDQTITYRLHVNNTYSPEYVRDISNIGSGVSILEYLFKDEIYGVFDVELQYKVGTGNAIVTGGSLKAFVSGNINPIPNNFLVTAKNLWNNNSITSFNVSVNDGSFFNSNSSGVAIVTGVNPSNLTISSPNYFSESYSNYNVSNDLNVSLFQNIINISIFETFSGTPITNWSLYNSTRLLINTTTNSGFFYPSENSSFNNLILKSNTGAFSDRSISSFNVSSLENRTILYNLLPTEFNVTVKNIVTDTNINNFSVTFFSLNRTHTDTFSTTAGSIVFGVVDNDVYNISVNADGYALFGASILQTINGTGSYEFSLYVTNTLNITFKNQVDNSLILSNVSVELISDVLNYVNSTVTGKLFLDLLSPQPYTVRYSAVGFDERFYYFTLTNRSYNEVTLYLTNESFSNVTATVYDQNNNLLEGAIINYLKYDSNTNSYLLMGMASTNFEGATILPIVLNTEYYKFQIYYGNVLRTTTVPSYVYETDLIFRVVLTDLVGQQFFDEQNILGTVSYNNVTSNAKFEFSSGDGLSYPFCLNIYETSLEDGRTLLNSSCSTVSSGMILIPFSIVNGTTYLLEGTVFKNNLFVVDSLYLTSEEAVPNKNLWLFMFLILSVVFGLMGLYSLRMSFILTPLPLFFGSLIGVIPIHPTITGGLVLLGIIFAGVINNG